MADIRPGLCSVTLRSLSVEEVAQAAHSAGLAGIEWGGDVHVPPGDLDASRRARNVCDDLGLELPSYGSYLGNRPDQGASAVVDTALALGAMNVRVWAGSMASADCDAQTRTATTAMIAGWCDLAGEHDLTVSLEYHSRTLTDTVASTLQLLVDADRPNLWCYWQPRDGVVDRLAAPGVVDRGTAGAQQGDGHGDDLVELGVIGQRLSHLHVFWWNHFFERHPLGEGAEFWPKALGQASQEHPWPKDRWAFLEFVRDDDPAQLQRDAAVLRDWLGLTEKRPV